MKLIAIQSYSAAAERIQRHLPYYAQPGWEILGVGSSGTTCNEWPADIARVPIGQPGQFVPGHDNLCQKLIGTIEYALNHYPGLSDLLIIEHDGIFLRPIPPLPPGLVTWQAGGYDGHGYSGPLPWPFCTTNKYFHPPWKFDLETAKIVAATGRALLEIGSFENGSPDVFISKIMDVADLPWQQSNTWSSNGLDSDLPQLRAACRQAIHNGAWHVHGIKTAEQLDFVLNCLKNCPASK